MEHVQIFDDGLIAIRGGDMQSGLSFGLSSRPEVAGKEKRNAGNERVIRANTRKKLNDVEMNRHDAPIQLTRYNQISRSSSSLNYI